ncbi:MAG: M48 family metalloprotease [Bacteriovoracaceae bacterium]|nr:M48 family metalloprotease [Bacteriovoracaceae bacterium]
MLSLFKSKNVTTTANTDYREFFKSQFFQSEHHHWIVANKFIQANFEEFFDKLPLILIKKFTQGPQLIFLASSGRYSCAINPLQAHVIIVFPELMKLLKSSATNHALAILAHEIGHIAHEHGAKVIDPIEAQVEADLFACKLGYALEIESFLEDQVESLEKRIRLTYVTAYLHSTNN